MTDKEILKAFNKKRIDDRCRIVIRPKFRLYKELAQVLSAIGIIAGVIILRSVFSEQIYAIVLSIAVILFVLTQTKNILLLMIFLYQKCAPKLIRSACLFQPSCSEYMRLSINKYGVFKGVKKGLNRLFRCRPPNGGLDEP